MSPPKEKAAAAAKSGKKKAEDKKSPNKTAKKPNNVTIGTLTEAKAAENEGSSATDRPDEDHRYVYRDFSLIAEEDFDVDYEIDQEGLLQVRRRVWCLVNNFKIYSLFWWGVIVWDLLTYLNPRFVHCYDYDRLWKSPLPWQRRRPCSSTHPAWPSWPHRLLL